MRWQYQTSSTYQQKHPEAHHHHNPRRHKGANDHHHEEEDGGEEDGHCQRVHCDAEHIVYSFKKHPLLLAYIMEVGCDLSSRASGRSPAGVTEVRHVMYHVKRRMYPARLWYACTAGHRLPLGYHRRRAGRRDRLQASRSGRAATDLCLVSAFEG